MMTVRFSGLKKTPRPEATQFHTACDERMKKRNDNPSHITLRAPTTDDLNLVYCESFDDNGNETLESDEIQNELSTKMQ